MGRVTAPQLHGRLVFASAYGTAARYVHILCMAVRVHPVHHITARHATGGHLGCMMDSYDIPEHWAVFYIAEAITALNVIDKVK